MASSLIPEIGSLINDQKYIYFGLAFFNIIIAIILSFGLKDVLKEKNSNISIANEENAVAENVTKISKWAQVVKLIKIVGKEFRSDAQYTVAILTSISVKVLGSTIMGVGQIYITNVYENMKIADADKRA